MIGLKRGTVTLFEHDPEWDLVAEQTIVQLKNILGDTACDIRHVGSTSIRAIKAKPIIDIAVGVRSLEDIIPFIPVLEKHGFRHKDVGHVQQVFFSAGNFDQDIRTHHIHVVQYNGMEWLNYLNFTAYLNTHPSTARQYEQIKETLANQFSNDRVSYTDGKADFIRHTLRKAMVWSYLGKTVEIGIDRPIGYAHKKDIVYPINYGFIPGVLGGDDEELDVYLLGVTEPVASYCAKIIAIVHRENDVEDKLVAMPEHMSMTQYEITQAIHFQEKYYDSHVEMLCNEYTIREYRPIDKKELRELGFNSCAESSSSPSKYTDAILTLSAYQNDHLLGIIRVYEEGASAVCIRDLFVHPLAQQRGIESKLLDEMISRYRETHQIYASVHTNIEWTDFYLRYGFKKTAQSDLLMIEPSEYATSSKKYSIRAMKEEEIPSCAALLQHSLENVTSDTPYPISEELLHKQFRDSCPMFVYVTPDDTPLGFYSLHIEDPQVIELRYLCITPEQRHAKLGEKLLLHAVREGMIRGYRHMTALIPKENKPLRTWLEKYGFVSNPMPASSLFPSACEQLSKKLYGEDS